MQYFIIKLKDEPKYFTKGDVGVLGKWRPIFSMPEDGCVPVLLMTSKLLARMTESLNATALKESFVAIPVDIPDGAS